jgi:hypothetical protein
LRKPALFIAVAATLLGAPMTRAWAESSGDQTVVVHKSHKHNATRHHAQTRREPPGGLIQDRDERSSNGKDPNALTPANH